MHVMFIHPNFPAQFGQLATHLSGRPDWTCTFVTSVATSHLRLPFQHLNYRVRQGPLPRAFYNPDDFQDLLEHLGALYTGLRGHPEIRPDLVVGHMSYGTMLYLRNLYRCPFVGYFEYLPPPFWGDGLVLRPEYPPPESTRLFNATYHALTLLHLLAVDGVYTPTHFQRDTAPPELRHKVRVLFDGVDAEFFRPRPVPRPASFRGLTLGPNTRVVTFASRGLESVRGFDVFMKVAKRISREIDDVLFLIAGDERTCYGHELHHIGPQSFKQYVLGQDAYDPGRFHFLGLIPPAELATLFNLSDLHVYLTVPFVLSWSLVMAMASGCTILGSATAPVREVIEHGVHGLLADFHDVEGLTAEALHVLRDPGQYRPLGAAARARVLARYELRHCIDRLTGFFEGICHPAR